MTEQDARREKTVLLQLDCELEQPIETVWRALAEPDLLAKWLLPDGALPDVGDGTALSGPGTAGGRIRCEVLDADAPRRMRLRWRERDAAGEIDTEVTFELAPTAAGGTRLRLVHDGFTVPADYPVDRTDTAEPAILVLLPAVARRRIRRPRRAMLRPGMAPVRMRLAA